MTTEKDRAIGCFMGLAIGDALGCPVEFKDPGEFEPVTNYRYSYVWNIPAGYWTDDTSMALCLADSILATGTIDHEDLMKRFCRWFEKGENSATGRCFDIGTTTRHALMKYVRTKTYEHAEDMYWASGNGSIMRLAPVALRWYNDRQTVVGMSREQGIVTHGSKECIAACEELGTLLGKSIRGEDIMTELQLFAADQKIVPNSGRASDTMISAKWAVGSTTNFRDAVLTAVNLGGDSDTIGAVAGQIAGSIYGYDSVPQEWKDGLYDEAKLYAISMALFYQGGTDV
jgi:ADP-ribosyl-[dinitrogen reductase] hydrolase